MLEYDRTDISEGIDVNKTNASKECGICHQQYFKDIGFKYEPYLCNDYHDLKEKAISFNDVAIAKGSAYKIQFRSWAKSDAIAITCNSNLVDKKGVLHFFTICKK